MNKNKNNKKVAIISNSLGSGGAERFAALLSVMLDKSDIEVHSIIINDVIDYSYTGELLSLEKECVGLYSFFKKLKKGIILNRYLNDNKIRIIVDNRTRSILIRELITKLIYRNAKVYYVVHSCNFKNYFPTSVFWARSLYKKAERLICVSEEIEQKISENFNLKNTTTIYNPFSISKNELEKKVLNQDKVILFFGRFDEKAKNFTLMLDAFFHSKVFLKGYSLHLMGAGDDLVFIQNKIKALGLEKFVNIYPFKNPPFEEVRKAKFTVLTSHYEGFPLSIIESLALGTPVIAVDCHSGPREVIKHEVNGLLIEKDNIEAFASAINRFIDDEKLYHYCKNNASESVKHLSLGIISEQWTNLILKNKNDK